MTSFALVVMGFLLGFGLSELLFEIDGIPILKHLSYKEKIENKTDKALKKKNKYLYSYIRLRIEEEAKKGHTSADIGTLFAIDCDDYNISPEEVKLFCEINKFCAISYPNAACNGNKVFGSFC